MHVRSIYVFDSLIDTVHHAPLTYFQTRIDSNGSIKVADFGLAEDVYTKTYFRQDSSSSVLVPFKWMPPESLEEGVFSEKSDVVSDL